MTLHNDLPYIENILDFILSIEESLEDITLEDFLKDKDKKEANIRRIELIGEAVKNISEEIKNRHPEVEWKKIAGARDNLIHRYFDIDLKIIWQILVHDIPILKKQIISIKKELNNGFMPFRM